MKKYNEFLLEKSGKFINVDYKIILTDLKDNPKTLIIDFKIINQEDKKLIIKAKGYNKIKGGWEYFDDFKDDNTRKVWTKHVDNGSKRIKIID